MPKIAYRAQNFRPAAMEIIRRADAVCRAYQQQGLDLTLRQLFYYFVSHDWLPNKQSEYKRLGDIINDARMAGYIDWDHIVDRTRNLRFVRHFDDPADAVKSAADRYAIDHWTEQEYRVEVWIEKDALVGVLESVCPNNDVPFFSCRGYTSASEMWGASQRIYRYLQDGQKAVILHLGDHDPSGMDMTRDIEERLFHFLAVDHMRREGMSSSEAIRFVQESFKVDRIALNMDQIEQYDPPPNPAKITDTRASKYIDEYGPESWELDALEPQVLVALIQQSIERYRDPEMWDDTIAQEEREREVLQKISDNWISVQEFLEEEEDD